MKNVFFIEAKLGLLSPFLRLASKKKRGCMSSLKVTFLRFSFYQIYQNTRQLIG